MKSTQRIEDNVCTVCGEPADDADWIGDDKYIYWCEDHIPHMPKENQIP